MPGFNVETGRFLDPNFTVMTLAKNRPNVNSSEGSSLNVHFLFRMREQQKIINA